MYAATLFLALVSSAMLTQTMASVPFNCHGRYRNMNIDLPFKLLRPSGVSEPHGPCVNPANGDFVVTYWTPNSYTYLFNSNGDIKKKINIPSEAVTRSCGCIFAGGKLFMSATEKHKILQYTSDGEFEKVFATGHEFDYFAVQFAKLYVSIRYSKDIIVFDVYSGKIVKEFKVPSGDGRGLAFDPLGKLHIAIWGKNIVDIVTSEGDPVKTITYPGVSGLDGIVIDNSTNSILVDRVGRKVVIFDKNDKLVKTIPEFHYPIDVAMGYKCKYIIVTDMNHGTFLLN